MNSPIITYKDFFKNPIVGLLFMCICAIGWLYLDNRNTLTDQIVRLEAKVKSLEEDNKLLYNKILEISKKVN